MILPSINIFFVIYSVVLISISKIQKIAVLKLKKLKIHKKLKLVKNYQLKFMYLPKKTGLIAMYRFL